MGGPLTMVLACVQYEHSVQKRGGIVVENDGDMGKILKNEGLMAARKGFGKSFMWFFPL